MYSQSLHLSAISILAFAVGIHAAKRASSGCGSALPKEVTIGGPSFNFTNFASNSSADNPLRAYSLAVPIDYSSTEPAPSIFSFHGRGENNKDQEDQSMFSDPYFNTKAISVYPMGIDRQWQGDPSAPPSINDTLFILELITHLSSRYCISPTQIYAAGKSNGGGFTGLLACNPSISSQIAAFAAAPLAWYLDPVTASVCGNGSQQGNMSGVPILEIHGGKDTRIVYGGGPDANRPGQVTEAIPAWLQGWAERDGCSVSAAVTGNQTEALEGVVGDNEVSVTRWGCATGGAVGNGGKGGLVEHYFSKNMKHVWPTAGNAGFNGTRVIMEFFGRFG